MTATATVQADRVSVTLTTHVSADPSVSVSIDGRWATSGRYDPRNGQVYDAPGDLGDAVWSEVDRLATSAYQAALSTSAE